MDSKKKGLIDRLISAIASKSEIDTEDFTFEDFETADEIIVTTNLNEELGRITSPEKLKAVLGFLQEHKTSWHVPIDGVPVAMLRLNFYKAGEILGNVGIDVTFLTTHQFGSFWSKESNILERQKIIDIIDLDG